MLPYSEGIDDPAPRPSPADPTPTELGRRIKLLRVARNLTLKEIEKRGGISATHVSEIERGKASPTVGALARIAQALGVRPATLIEPRVLPEVTVMRVAGRERRAFQEGRATLEPLTEPVHGAEVSAFLMTLPIGLGPALTHHHEGEELATVLTGVVEIRIGDETHVLREGDSLHFRGERAHSYINPASSPAVVLVANRTRAGF